MGSRKWRGAKGETKVKSRLSIRVASAVGTALALVCAVVSSASAEPESFEPSASFGGSEARSQAEAFVRESGGDYALFGLRVKTASDPSEVQVSLDRSGSGLGRVVWHSDSHAQRATRGRSGQVVSKAYWVWVVVEPHAGTPNVTLSVEPAKGVTARLQDAYYVRSYEGCDNTTTVVSSYQRVDKVVSGGRSSVVQFPVDAGSPANACQSPDSAGEIDV